MKHKKPTGNILFILTLVLISSVGIGFSSWALGNTITPGNGEINVEIGEYSDYVDCVTLDDTKPNGGYIPLSYTTTGFINKTSTKTDAPTYKTEGELTFFVKFNLKNCKAKLDAFNDLCFIPTLKVSEISITAFKIRPVFSYLKLDLTPYPDGSGEQVGNDAIKHIFVMQNALLYSYDTLDCIFTYNISSISDVTWGRIVKSMDKVSFTLMMNLGGKNAKEANV